MRYKRAHPMGPRFLTWLRSPAGERTAVLVGFLALAIVWTWPLALRPGTTMAAPFGDPLLNAWILGWDADRLRHGLSGLWTAPPFYPYPDTLAYSEHLLGIAVPLAPIYWLTGNAVLLYNVALIGSFALAGIGMYLLARDLTGRRDAAVLAALAFMWCPNRAPQVTHLQVLMNGWMPIALWALHRYFATGSRRALAGFAAAFVVQGLSNGYFLFFLARAGGDRRDRRAGAPSRSPDDARDPPGGGGDRDRPADRAGGGDLPAREARSGAVADARRRRPVRGAAGGLRHGQPPAAAVVEDPADRRGREGAVPGPRRDRPRAGRAGAGEASRRRPVQVLARARAGRPGRAALRRNRGRGVRAVDGAGAGAPGRPPLLDGAVRLAGGGRARPRRPACAGPLRGRRLRRAGGARRLRRVAAARSRDGAGDPSRDRARARRGRGGRGLHGPAAARARSRPRTWPPIAPPTSGSRRSRRGR